MIQVIWILITELSYDNMNIFKIIMYLKWIIILWQNPFFHCDHCHFHSSYRFLKKEQRWKYYISYKFLLSGLQKMLWWIIWFIWKFWHMRKVNQDFTLLSIYLSLKHFHFNSQCHVHIHQQLSFCEPK